MKTNFEIWRDSDNVIRTAENGYKTQCGQYKKTHTEDELKAYFIKEYCENNKERADEIADLFEHYDELPEEVKKLIDKNKEFQSYEYCEEFKNKLHKIGYTCEYGLDNIPHSLRKLQTTNETTEEMKTTENIVFEHENKQVVKKGNHFFTRITENGESFESADFNTLERAKESLGIELTTEEKNILIAEFLQVDKNTNGTFELPQHCKITLGGTFKTEFRAEQLMFHKDYNWLMEVAEKIKEIDSVTDFNINFLTGYTTIESYCETDNTKNKVSFGNGEGIDGIYNACVEFIKWYNEQNK